MRFVSSVHLESTSDQMGFVASTGDITGTERSAEPGDMMAHHENGNKSCGRALPLARSWFRHKKNTTV